MRKILLATPLRGELSATYLNILFSVMGRRFAGVSMGHAMIGATAVQWARDEAVQMARDKGCTEIIFWDKDLEPQPEHWERMIANTTHDVLCSLYAKRDPMTHWHATFIEEKGVGEDGIAEVFQSAIGFSRIKMSVFDRLRDKYPERQYTVNNAGDAPLKLFEYFPMERVGPNTAEGKLARIREIVETIATEELTPYEILKVLDDTDYSQNAMHGEDYGFCRLCRRAGIPIHLDTKMLVQHNGECRFPLPTEQLRDMLKEEWRAEK